MRILVAFLIVVAVTAITVSAMLVVRRRAPEGSYFRDGDRASGVFGVLATGFSVLLGFIIFLAFASYDESRSGAETEAIIVAQQVQTAQFLPGSVAAELTGELHLLRAVGGRASGRPGCRNAGGLDQPVGGRDVPHHQVGRPPQRAPSSRPTTGGWTRPPRVSRRGTTGSTGRRGSSRPRCGSSLFVISAVIFVYMLFFADRGEGAVTQGVLMGSVTVVITSAMLLLALPRPPARHRGRRLDRPRWSGPCASSTPSSGGRA